MTPTDTQHPIQFLHCCAAQVWTPIMMQLPWRPTDVSVTMVLMRAAPY